MAATEHSDKAADHTSGYQHPDDRTKNLTAALQFVYPAYALSEDRTDAINRRLETAMGAPLAIVPAFVIAADGQTYFCWPFILGLVFMLGTILLALWHRAFLTVEVLDLDAVIETSDVESAYFAERVLTTAERDTGQNAKANYRKSAAALWSVLLLVFGLASLVAWLAFCPTAEVSRLAADVCSQPWLGP